MTEQISAEADDFQACEGYGELLASIRHNFDPRSNTVLLVDDARAIRKKVARDVLAFAADIHIYEAANGREALEKLAEIRNTCLRDPLFIVLDLHMPIMDGWEVIRLLKEEYTAQGKSAGIPIIVLSSTSGEKGGFLRKQSIHGGKAGYHPLVSVAKEACADTRQYDAKGEKGLMAWLEYFVRRA
jgi:CheY-like chemotaxis protein